MRAALISMAGQPCDSDGKAPLALAGKTLARRQLDFALAAGCERIIALGDGASAEAVALRHAAEAAGAGFQAIRDSQALLGAVRATDELLVLVPGLLPEANEALDALGPGGAVLVLPAGAGVAAGFERIDLERAWAGAAIVPGALIERLSELPADIEPASALMRAALQVRVTERRLPEDLLAEGTWSILGSGADLIACERAWLKRHTRPHQAFAGSLRGFTLPLSGKLLAAPRSVPFLAGAAAAVVAGAVAAAWFGLAVLSFALIPLASLLVGYAGEVARLRAAPFGRKPHPWAAALPWLVDLALVACAVLAIEGSWLHRLFPPLVLLAALHLPSPPGLAAGVRNRALLGGVFAIAAGFGAAEPAIMLAALVPIALNAALTAAKRG